MKRDAAIVKAHGEKHGISYLVAPSVPIPDLSFATYLAAIGVKVTGSEGVYPADAGPVTVFIMLKNLREHR